MRRQFGRTSLIPFVLSVLLLAACNTPAAKAPKADNINANITNQGMSVMHNGWIYYGNLGDKGYLYKIKDDLTGEAKVSDVIPHSLNAQGDWLYFTNSEDLRLYKIKPDGSDKTLVSDEGTQNVLVADDWIYYIKMNTGTKEPGGSGSTEDSENNRIFRIKTDGTGRQKLSGEMASGFNLAGGWIYYAGTRESNLYKMKVDGTENAKVSDVPLGRFSILEDYIYYIAADAESPRMWKMKLDGTGAVKLSEDKAMTMNPSGGWIYYGGIEETGSGWDSSGGFNFPDFQLKKMKLDGSEATVINDDNPMLICVHGDTLVYMGVDMANFSVKQTILKTDGTGRKDFLMPMDTSNNNQEPEGKNSESENQEQQNVEIFKMDEEASTSDIMVKLVSAVTTGENIIANLTVTSLSGEVLELSQLIAFIDEADNTNDFAAMYADITNDPGKDDPRYQVPMEKLDKRMSLQAKETKALQVRWDLNKKDVRTSSGDVVFIGLFQGMELKALIQFIPDNNE